MSGPAKGPGALIPTLEVVQSVLHRNSGATHKVQAKSKIKNTIHGLLTVTRHWPISSFKRTGNQLGNLQEVIEGLGEEFPAQRCST